MKGENVRKILRPIQRCDRLDITCHEKNMVIDELVGLGEFEVVYKRLLCVKILPRFIIDVSGINVIL